MSDSLTRTVAGFTDWAATYDRTIAEEVERYSGMAYAEVLQRVTEAAAPPVGAKVLDIGTGTGALAFLIARAAPGAQVIGIDPTSAMLERATKNAERVGLRGRIEFRQAKAEALPFADGTFDLVVSNFAMHHTQVRQSLPEIARVLRPGGRLAIGDGARNPKWQSTLGCLVIPLMVAYYMVTKRSWAMMQAEVEGYKNIFYAHDWERMLADAGFAQATVTEYPHPKSSWYSSVLIIQAEKARPNTVRQSRAPVGGVPSSR